MTDRTRFAIKYNNCAANDPCAVCGTRTDPICGPELFMADTWDLVCHSCGEKYAPELLAGLRMAQGTIGERESW